MPKSSLKSDWLLSLIKAVIFLLAAVLASSLVTVYMPILSFVFLDYFWIQLLPIIILHIFLCIAMAFVFPIKINDVINNLRSFWALSIASAVLLLLGLILFYFLNEAFSTSPLKDIFNYNFVLQLGSLSFSETQIIGIVLLLLVQTLFEEWFFRGWLLGFLSNFIPAKHTQYSEIIVVVIGAFLFALLHIISSNFAIASFILSLMFGIIWGYISVQTKVFITTWPLHFINNLFFTFAVGYNQFFFTESSFFQMDNLPNNVLWQIIYISLNLVLLWFFVKSKAKKLRLAEI